MPCRLPTDRAIDELSDEVGVTVVAGVLLDHVGIDPSQRAPVGAKNLIRDAELGRF